MYYVKMFFFALAFVAGAVMASLAHAQQSPTPKKEPVIAQCTTEDIAIIEEEIADLQKLRGVSVDTILIACSGIEKSESLIRSAARAAGQNENDVIEKLDDVTRGLTKSLGMPPVDFRLMKHTCVQGAGELDRWAMEEIAGLKKDIEDCKPI